VSREQGQLFEGRARRSESDPFCSLALRIYRQRCVRYEMLWAISMLALGERNTTRSPPWTT
jgi:hypothetical protein